MDLNLPVELAKRYKSASQRARIVTEAWAAGNLYCPACTSRAIHQTQVNTEAVDFVCPKCAAPFQLKSTRNSIGRKITDAGYDSMIRALQKDCLPHLLVLQYDNVAWGVKNLLLVPSFMMSASAIQARRPLSKSARRAGWVGCNIVLDQVPPEGRIPMVSKGSVLPSAKVREHFNKLRVLQRLPVESRGWTLDVLTTLRNMGKMTFALADVYSFEELLGNLHPHNQNVRAKIRQQLQVIRDLGYLEFQGRGVYKWRE